MTTALPSADVGTPISSDTSGLTSPRRITVETSTRLSTVEVIQDAFGSAAFAAACAGDCARVPNHHDTADTPTSAPRTASHHVRLV